ncbi:MAG: hypothetical protein KatS3mg057_1569 [Herpetosiphonaceae bacterium]|nr:MAG: hypothetical protein KatS3mg057_1569 [Herpetosiphonaceae bacterium]
MTCRPLTSLPAGARYLADLGFFRLARLAALAAQGGSFLSRWQAGTALFTAEGQRVDDVVAWLEAQESLAVEAVLVVARARWHIELVFKRWKSQGHIDESRSGKPWRMICDVDAKVLAMQVHHWIRLIGLWNYADRSLAKAVRTVQQYAMQLASGCWNHRQTCETVETIARVLWRGCRMNTRRKAPNRYQLLLAVSEHDLP